MVSDKGEGESPAAGLGVSLTGGHMVQEDWKDSRIQMELCPPVPSRASGFQTLN